MTIAQFISPTDVLSPAAHLQLNLPLSDVTVSSVGQIFNLSERRSELSELNRHVAEYGWPETLAPPLDKLCSICKAIDGWTSAEPHNVAVLHSSGSGGDG